MSAPLIWAGNFAKFLKSQLNLGDQVYILNGSADPTVTPQLAPAGSIYMLNVAGSANVYLKNDAGSSTNWTLLASGISLTAVNLKIAMGDEFDSSVYQFMNQNILGFAFNGQLNSFTGTAAYDNIAKQVNFGATPGAQVISKQQLDVVEFINQPTLVSDLSQIDLTVFWATGAVDTGAIYEASRDGGVTYQTVTMQNAGVATEVYGGSLKFAVTETPQSLVTIGTNNGTFTLNATTQQGLAQKFTVASNVAQVIQQVTLTVSIAGTPAGNIVVKIVKDSAGTPSLLGTDVLQTSSNIAASSITAGAFTFTLTNTVLTTGTYWIVIQGDTTYASTAGSSNFTFQSQTGASADVAKYNGTIWSTSNADFTWTLLGRPLDLRVRINSSIANTKLNGWAIQYRQTTTIGVVSSVRKTQRFSFNSVTDNTSSFTITAFVPDPDLLVMYYVQGGQSFKVPAFDLQGSVAVFPANSFNNGGTSATITLIADQNNGGAFDNSDFNANLLAQNHLGSTSGAYDRSVAGRGILLRRPDGTLREIAVDNLDNLFILSVP